MSFKRALIFYLGGEYHTRWQRLVRWLEAKWRGPAWAKERELREYEEAEARLHARIAEELNTPRTLMRLKGHSVWYAPVMLDLPKNDEKGEA